MPFLLGIDLGTSACKASLLSAEGQSFSAESDPLILTSPHPHWAEQDPADWWQAVGAAIHRVLHLAGCSPTDVAAIGLSGQMHSLVLLDGRSQVLRPAILWCDARSTAQCTAVLERVPSVETITRNKVIPAFTLPKLLWVRDNEPTIYREIQAVLLPKDHTRLRMTGERATEPSDASGTTLFDSVHLRWSTEILDAFGIPSRWLPPLVHSTSPTGRLTIEAASELGLVPGIPVIGGAGDQAAQAVAMGVTDPGLLGITVGTSGVVVMAETQPLFGSFCHAVSDRWLLLNSMHAAGLSLSWFRENLVPDVSYEDLMHLAAQAPAGCSNLIFLPFLLGERDTGRHSLSACYYGLTPQHGRTYLVRALLEGVTFELRRMRDLWTEQGLVADQVHLSGGASRNELWRTIMAAVLNLAIERMDRDASFGAALLAGVGAGWWNSPEEGYLATRPAGRHEMPEPVLVERYAHIYTRYLALYRLLSAAAAHGDLDDVG